MDQKKSSTGFKKRLNSVNGFPHFVGAAKHVPKLSFEQEVAQKRKLLHNSDNLQEPVIFDNPPVKTLHQDTFPGFQESKGSDLPIVLSSLPSTRSRKVGSAPKEVTEQEDKATPNEIPLDGEDNEPSLEVPLGQLIAFLFDCIFSSEYAQIFLKHLRDDSDLSKLELTYYRKPSSLKDVFDSLYCLINSHETELLKIYSVKSLCYQRCEHFRDFLSTLRRSLISPATISTVNASVPLSESMQTVKDFVFSRESELYFLRFGSSKPFQLPDYDVANPILNLHLPVFNWLESKLISGAFKGEEDSIRELDSNVTTIGRFYIMNNRTLIQDCLDDSSSIILMCVTLNLDAKVNHFLLFVRPFGDQRKMSINSRGDLEGYPKSWFWGKIVKCLLLDQDYQLNKAAFKPVHIGNLNSEIPARFIPLTELFGKYAPNSASK